MDDLSFVSVSKSRQGIEYDTHEAEQYTRVRNDTVIPN